MRKLSLLAMLGLSVLLAGGAQAQKKPAPPTGGGMMKPASAATSVNGLVKGTPSGGSFVLASKKGTVTVTMGKGVRARDKSSKFASIKPGSNVTAVGTMSGTTLTATAVTVNSTPGGRKADKGKMDDSKAQGSKMEKMDKMSKMKK